MLIWNWGNKGATRNFSVRIGLSCIFQIYVIETCWIVWRMFSFSREVLAVFGLETDASSHESDSFRK
jgi:hypothetical protein